MRKFFRNCRGAVTVMVTLLLIPAILVSGTGVDLARIYAARSVVQDANQLAANSVLASYDALLQDLYGLFGVMEENLGIAEEYVTLAVEGENWNERGMGTFQTFYGTVSTAGAVTPAPHQTLSNPDVLRRQIEEYSKFRAPVVIVSELGEKLEIFEKTQEDAKVIQKKMEVDDGVEELESYYRKIYDHIVEADACRAREISIMDDITVDGRRMQDMFREMSEIKEEYTQVVEDYEQAERAYDNALDSDVRATIWEEMQELEKEGLALQLEYQDMWGQVQEVSKQLEKDFRVYEDTLEEYDKELEKLLDDCKTADRKKKDLQKTLEELRESLDSGECSTALSDGLTTPQENGKSILDQYEDLLKYDIEKMGQDMYDADHPQITNTIEIEIKGAKLGGFLLTDFQSMDMDTHFPIDPDKADSLETVLSDTVRYEPDAGRDRTGFLLFQDISSTNKKFYDELVKIYQNSGDNGAKKSTLKEATTKIFAQAQDMFGGLVFEPEGAKYLSGGSDTSNPATGTDFGTEGEWDDEDEGKEYLEDSLDDDFLSLLANTANEVGNKILLLVYATEMFSDSSTPVQDEDGCPVKNMAGIPLSTDVNYYFQSELEYLYNGNLQDAVDNLRSVAGMIFLVRFVFDYVASFSVSSVNSTVNSVKSALSWTGPFAILAGELARLGLTIGEAAIDVSRLRSGDEVAIYKKNDTWKLSIAGMANAAFDGISDAAVESAFGKDTGGSDSEDEGLTMSYTDYMRLFLLLVDGDVLARRVSDLIELNVTNKSQGLNADEEAMAAAERFDMSRAITDFQISTTVDLRMLFLSMPFAQSGIDGVVPPRSLSLTVVDYRGY